MYQIFGKAVSVGWGCTEVLRGWKCYAVNNWGSNQGSHAKRLHRGSLTVSYGMIPHPRGKQSRPSNCRLGCRLFCSPDIYLHQVSLFQYQALYRYHPILVSIHGIIWYDIAYRVSQEHLWPPASLMPYIWPSADSVSSPTTPGTDSISFSGQRPPVPSFAREHSTYGMR